jgi:hypothetical protein
VGLKGGRWCWESRLNGETGIDNKPPVHHHVQISTSTSPHPHIRKSSNPPNSTQNKVSGVAPDTSHIALRSMYPTDRLQYPDNSTPSHRYHTHRWKRMQRSCRATTPPPARPPHRPLATTQTHPQNPTNTSNLPKTEKCSVHPSATPTDSLAQLPIVAPSTHPHNHTPYTQ